MENVEMKAPYHSGFPLDGGKDGKSRLKKLTPSSASSPSVRIEQGGECEAKTPRMRKYLSEEEKMLKALSFDRSAEGEEGGSDARLNSSLRRKRHTCMISADTVKKIETMNNNLNLALGTYALDDTGGFLQLMLSRQGHEAEKMRRFRSKLHGTTLHKQNTATFQSSTLEGKPSFKTNDCVGAKKNLHETLLSVRNELNSESQKNGLQKQEISILQNIDTEVDLSDMFDWNFGARGVFDSPDLASVRGHELYLVFWKAFVHYDLCCRFPVQAAVVHRFLLSVESHYMDVAYHNRFHAVDCVQTVFWMLTSGQIDRKENLTVNTIFAALVGAAIHDLGHPGKGNSFHVNSENDLSLAYNDLHCLENYHLFLAFSIMRLEAHDILGNISVSDKREVRQLLVDSVISTDPSLHLENLEKFQRLLESQEKIDLSNINHASILCSTILHAADISSPAKEWDVYKQWIDRIFYEFIEQGDAEHELGILPVPMMDRTLACPPTAQKGFISYLVLPLYELFSRYVPKLDHPIQMLHSNSQKLSKWESAYDDDYIDALFDRKEDIIIGVTDYALENRRIANLKMFDFNPHIKKR